MKVISILAVALLFFGSSYAQELYPYSEPASNNPAQSVAVKATAFFHGDVHGDKTVQRYMPEVALGLSKKWMVKAGANFSNMQQENLHAFQSLNYSLSAGYLLLPVEYKDYDQTNLNLYVELLGGRNFKLPGETYFVDLAPSLQAIFNSTAKLNVGYRFQLGSDIYRMTKNSVMISFEYLFLNALKRKAN
ncbi:MAG: hypothetical protein EOO14_03000 [Chitinophagaceae bacterium]|nr:MAG: hypothetical protein EOO14_03000 [Chitinophagaceae bacterium]